MILFVVGMFLGCFCLHVCRRTRQYLGVYSLFRACDFAGKRYLVTRWHAMLGRKVRCPRPSWRGWASWVTWGAP